MSTLGPTRQANQHTYQEHPQLSTPYESAQCLMQLYELRREDKLREARTYVIRAFNPESVEDVAAVMQTDDYTYVRMVVGYWDMAASFVQHGAIDKGMFRDSSGEMLATYSKFEHIIEELREALGQPGLLKNVEAVAADWPGAKERMAGMREYFADLAKA
jgi:hypothetical protein